MPQNKNRGLWITLACCVVAALAVPRLMAQPEGGLMTKEDSSYAAAEWHKRFAVELNNRVWELLSKTDRTEQENEEMIHASHASHFHWSKVGKPVNLQRGEWLISHVYAVLNRAEPALYHAKKCMALTDEHKLVDFDLAYAYEAMARANAAAGNGSDAKKYLASAQSAAQEIKEEEDRKLFTSDLQSGPWYGVK